MHFSMRWKIECAALVEAHALSIMRMNLGMRLDSGILRIQTTMNKIIESSIQEKYNTGVVLCV